MITLTPVQRQRVEEYLKKQKKTPYPVLTLELTLLKSELDRAKSLLESLTPDATSIRSKQRKLRNLVNAINGINAELRRDLTNHLSPTRQYIAMFRDSLRAIHHQSVRRERYPRQKDQYTIPRLADRQFTDNLDILLDETLTSLIRSCQDLDTSLSSAKHGHYYKTTFPHILTRGGLITFIAAGFREIATTQTSEISNWLNFLHDEVFEYAKPEAKDPYRKWIKIVAGRTREERNAFVEKYVREFDKKGYLSETHEPNGHINLSFGSKAEKEESERHNQRIKEH